MIKVKKSLKLSTILSLEIEINGQKGFKPIVSENINIQIKYWLGKFGKVLKKEVDEFDSMRNDLVKKYGIVENGKTYVPKTIPDPNFVPVDGEENQKIPMITNPNSAKFYQEVLKLLDIEVELEVPTWSISSFDFKTDSIYRSVEENLITD